MSLKTSKGVTSFFHLLDRSFPPGHKLHRLLNRNTVKLSYSCMPNIKSIITMHNKSTLAKCAPKQNVSTRNDCNCRKSEECPLQNKCQTKGIIYQATVTRQDNMTVETYIGLTANSFKSRFNNHNSNSNNFEQRNATTLSEHIWNLQDKDIRYTINWKIISKAKPYSTSSKKCNLCTEEKYFIIY